MDSSREDTVARYTAEAIDGQPEPLRSELLAAAAAGGCRLRPVVDDVVGLAVALDVEIPGAVVQVGVIGLDVLGYSDAEREQVAAILAVGAAAPDSPAGLDDGEG